MNGLLESVVEECALEGAKGVLLHDLFESVAKSRSVCISTPLQSILWKRMRTLPSLEFSFDSKSGVQVAGQELEEDLSRMDGRQQLRITAVEAARKATLGLRNATTQLGEIPLRMLEIVAASRGGGVLQSQLALKLDIDPKNVFHHLKPLKAQSLVTITPVLRKGDGEAGKGRTNLITLTRFSQASKEGEPAGTGDANDDKGPDKEGLQERGIFVMQDRDLEQLTAAVRPVLAACVDHMMPESALKAKITGSKKGDRRHHEWERIRRTLESQNVIERVLVRRGEERARPNAKPQTFVKLKASPVTEEEQGQPAQAFVAQVSMLEQLLRCIKEAGPEGVLSVAIGQRFQIDGKRLYSLLLQTARCFGVQATPENFGKVTAYRLVWAPPDQTHEASMFSPARQIGPDIAAAAVRPPGTDLNTQVRSQGASPAIQGASTAGAGYDPLLGHAAEVVREGADAGDAGGLKELTRAGIMQNPGWDRQPITEQWLRRANHTMRTLSTKQAMLVPDIRNALNKLEFDAWQGKPESRPPLVDSKTVDRLVTSLTSLKLVVRSSVNWKEGVKAEDEEGRMVDVVHLTSVALDDPVIHSVLAAPTSRPALNLPMVDASAHTEYHRARREEPQQPSVPLTALTLNGYCAALMIRLYALHSFIARTYLFSPTAPPDASFSIVPMLEAMPLLLFLQVVGCGEYLEDVHELCRNDRQIHDLPPPIKARLAYDSRQVLRRVLSLMGRLADLGLVKGTVQTQDDGVAVKKYKPATSVNVQEYLMPAFQSKPSFALESQVDLEEYWRCLALSAMSPLTVSKRGDADGRPTGGIVDKIPELLSRRAWHEAREVSLRHLAAIESLLTMLGGEVTDQPLTALAPHSFSTSPQALELVAAISSRVLISRELTAHVLRSAPSVSFPFESQIAPGHTFAVTTSAKPGAKRAMRSSPSLGQKTQGLLERKRKRRSVAGGKAGGSGRERADGQERLEGVGEAAEVIGMEADEGDGDEEAEQPAVRPEPRRRQKRRLWRFEDDVRLQCACLLEQKRRGAGDAQPEAAHAADEGGEDESAGGVAGTAWKKEGGHKVPWTGLDWAAIGERVGRISDQCRRRFCTLRGSVQMLVAMQKKVSSGDADALLATMAEGGGDVGQLRQELAKELSLLLSSCCNLDPTKLAAVEPSEPVRLPATVQALQEQFSVHPIRAPDRFVLPKSALGAALVDALMLIVAVDDSEYDSVMAFQLLGAFPQEEVERWFANLKRSRIIVKRSSAQRKCCIHSNLEEVLRPSKHWEELGASVADFVAEHADRANWPLGFTASGGAVLSVLALLLESSLQVQASLGNAFGEDEAVAEGKRTATGGVRKHLEMMQTAMETEDCRRIDEGKPLPECSIDFKSRGLLQVQWATGVEAQPDEDGQQSDHPQAHAEDDAARMDLDDADAGGQSSHVATSRSPEDWMLLPYWSGDGGEDAKAACQRDLQAAESCVKAAGVEGHAEHELQAIMADKHQLAVERFTDLITTLLNQGRILRVRGADEHRLVSSDHRATWEVPAAADDVPAAAAAPDDAGPDVESERRQLHGPWLTLWGADNVVFYTALRKAILELVHKSPGIPERLVLKHFFMLNHRTLLDVVAALEAEGQILTRALRHEKCSLLSSPTALGVPLHIPVGVSIPTAAGPEVTERYFFPQPLRIRPNVR